MAKISKKASFDDTDRLKNVALWYWEYMRRNPLYRRYCAVIDRYNNFFQNIGVYDYMQSKEYIDEMMEYSSTHEGKEELRYTPFRLRLERDHGEQAGLLFFKYGFLSFGFENKFGRIYKSCTDGVDTDAVIMKLINNDDVSFSTENIADIAALVKLNGQWLITVDGFTPNTFCFDLKRSKEIKILPQAIIEEPGKVGLEVYALSIINKAVESLLEKQQVPLETYESVYKLSLAGKHINSTDAMRLTMLWMWDKAHEVDGQEPLPFDQVYRLLKDRIEKAGATGGVWEQILYRKPRIREYYESTERCIQQVTIIPLKSK
ncbi:hypothetical protein [Fundidesulfovibrio butyratiphilus]